MKYYIIAGEASGTCTEVISSKNQKILISRNDAKDAATHTARLCDLCVFARCLSAIDYFAN
jgi:hypothetical protein